MFSQLRIYLLVLLALTVSALPSSNPSLQLQLQDIPTCSRGLTACSAPSPSFGVQGWQCVDFDSNPSSCGGCTSPFPPGFPPSLRPRQGTDCTSLPGIKEVDCLQGRCEVWSCMPGWEIGKDAEECVRKGGP